MNEERSVFHRAAAALFAAAGGNTGAANRAAVIAGIVKISLPIPFKAGDAPNGSLYGPGGDVDNSENAAD